MLRQGSLFLGILVMLLIVGFTWAQTTQGPSDVDQPVSKATGAVDENQEEEEEDEIPEPPPYFGEDGASGEKMKIVWCLDRSGSMSWSGGTYTGPDGQPTTGTRWERALSETTKAMSQLTAEWEFGAVTYNCGSIKFKPELVEADEANVAACTAWLAGQYPNGGTGTGPAQANAFRLADTGIEGTATCWLLSDGQPNCGATGLAGHKMVALSANTQGHVLNTVGIADTGVFADFMRSLAEETGGIYVHVQ